MAQAPDAYTATASIDIEAPPDRVYDLIADVARVGEFSPEATGARGASRAPQSGEHFWVFNKRGPWRWFTRCTVLSAERGRRFSGSPRDGDCGCRSCHHFIHRCRSA